MTLCPTPAQTPALPAAAVADPLCQWTWRCLAQQRDATCIQRPLLQLLDLPFFWSPIPFGASSERPLAALCPWPYPACRGACTKAEGSCWCDCAC